MKIYENQFPKKLNILFKKKEKKLIQFKNVPINFKIIPNNIELLERKMQRNFIIHYHKMFQNEQSNFYNDEYLDSFYNNLYHNQRNKSFNKKPPPPFNSLTQSKSQFFYNTTGKINKSKKKLILKLPDIKKNKNGNRFSTMSMEHLNFFKTNHSVVNLFKNEKKYSLNKNKSFSHSKKSVNIKRNKNGLNLYLL